MMPPRHGKSEMVSHWLPVWALNVDPTQRVMLASYEADFAASWGRRVRNTIAEYSDLLSVSIAQDSAAANRWNTTEGGGMITAGVGGPITGRGADWLIVDDPIKNAQEAQSQTVREHIWDWWRTTAYTRLEPNGRALLVMTRWHEDDLAGKLIDAMDDDGEPWDVIRLPATALANDPLGRSIDEPLWPERYDRIELDRISGSVGEAAWQSLYQQQPTPPGGTIFRTEWFDQRFDAEDGYSRSAAVARWISWDTGFKDNDTAAYTVAVVMELMPDYRLYIQHVYRERLAFPDLIAEMQRLTWQWNRDNKLRGVIIEDRASGTSAYQTLVSAGSPDTGDFLIPFSPVGSKEQRAQQAAVWCRNESVTLPAPSDYVAWLFDFERELFAAPASQYMDQVDAFSQGVIYLEHYLSEGYQARGFSYA